MKRTTVVVLLSWLIAGLATGAAIITWGQSFDWQFADISLYLLFPLFGLVAFSLMWSHYLAGVIRRLLGVPKSVIQSYLTSTGFAVLALILLHPGLLIWQLWRDGLGLPPGSYLSYVGPSLGWVVVLGVVSLLVLLAYELRPWFHDRPWWPWVVWAGNLAMIAIFYHGLRLGSQTQTGWYHWLWWFYGMSLVGALAFNYYVDRRAKLPKEG